MGVGRTFFGSPCLVNPQQNLHLDLVHPEAQAPVGAVASPDTSPRAVCYLLQKS